MPKERPPLTLTIEQVAAHAKQQTLLQGEHPNTVIIEGSKKVTAVAVPDMGATHEERAQRMFAVGYVLAQEGDIGVLQQVFFITEAWMSTRVMTDEDGAFLRPSLDPQRKEVLTVAQQQLSPPKTQIVIYEMKRNQRGKLVGLADMRENFPAREIQPDSPLLQAFVIGYLGMGSKPQA